MSGIPANRAGVNLIASCRPWHSEMASRLQAKTGQTFAFIGTPEELTPARLATLAPRYVFFPHWSHLIPTPVFEAYECIVFHMSDLPFGRGGSPLQNLVARGIYETRISALRCQAGIDAGPVYLKKPLSLHGSAQEIYLRAAEAIEAMIVEILAQAPIPAEQQGEPVVFSRRQPEESDLAPLSELHQVFDYIRMLDADGYPHAFLETDHLRLEFTRASLRPDCVVADVRITKK